MSRLNYTRLGDVPMTARIVHALENALDEIRFDVLEMAGGEMTGSDMRATVSDYAALGAIDPEAVRIFRNMSPARKARLLRLAVPAARYAIT